MTAARLEKAAWLCLLATLAFSGIFFMPKIQHVFWMTETFSARLLAPTAALLLLAAGKSRWGWSTRSGGTTLLYLLIGCWFLSAAFAFRKDLAAAELAGWLCYPLIFTACWSLGSTQKKRGALLFVILFSAAAQAAYALLQSAGIDFVSWAVNFNGRAGAFLGNPNFLGGHLAMLLPLALALALNERARHQGLRWALVALLTAALVATQTRGAWLGALAGLALLAFSALRHMPGLLERNRGRLLGMALFGAAALAAFLATHPGSLGRLKNIFANDAEISRRSTLWRCSAELVKSHPLLGIGPGNFGVFFTSVQASGMVESSLDARPYIVSEHAHNDLLQMAADAGLPALALWLALLAWLAAKLWKGIAARQGSVDREGPIYREPLLAAGALSGLAALAVHGLANFPFLILPTQMTAWALAAIGLRVCFHGENHKAEKNTWIQKGLSAALICLWFISALQAGRLLSRDGIWWRANGELELKNALSSRELAVKALSFDAGEEQLWALLGRAQASLGDTGQASEAWKKVLLLNPHDHETRVQLGRALLQAGLYAEAESVLAPTVVEAPNFRELWEPYAGALYMRAKFAEALQALNKAAAFDPGNAGIQINRAITAIKLGNRPEALASLQRAKEIDPGSPQILQLEKALK